MDFGDELAAAESRAPAAWIEASRSGRPGTVGALVPNQYRSVLRVSAPGPTTDDWWVLYRDLFGLVGTIGVRYTTTPLRGWFAIWEGHGFANATTQIAWSEPPVDDAERRARAAQRERLREEDRRRNAAISASLMTVPRFAVPDRSYYLVEGQLAAVTSLRYPGFDGWRNPDLWWPDDRRWFVATDVDFWSLYLGGDEAFTSELVRAAPTECELVTFDTPLEIED